MCPANVETMMYAGQAPWHNLGTFVGNSDITAADAIVKAGLDWSVGLAPMYTKINNVEIDCPDRQAVVRLSDNSILGTVGAKYVPVNNVDAFNFFDEIVGAGKAIYHTAGSLSAGAKIWILAKMPDNIIVGKDDVVEKYLLLSSTHDGTSSLRMLPTSVRVVCQNTMTLALNMGRGDGISIRHTANAQVRMAQTERAMQQVNKYYEMFNKHAQDLIKFNYTTRNLNELLSKLFPVPEGDLSRTVLGNVSAKRERITALFDEGLGHEQGGVTGTGWAALQAVGQWADFETKFKGTDAAKADHRLNSVWFGQASNIRQRAFDIIVEQMTG